MFFHLCKVLFLGFLQFQGNFVDGQNNSKYRDVAPLTLSVPLFTQVYKWVPANLMLGGNPVME